MRVLATLLTLLAVPAHGGGTVAFFGLHMLDTSLQTMTLGEDPDEARRLETLSDMVRDRFAREGYILVDLAPVADELARVVNPAKCYGCDARMAGKLGADFALVGEVQKVSNLILALNLQLRDAATGETVKGGVVDIRGNTDETWMRGMRYILNNRIFREEKKQ